MNILKSNKNKKIPKIILIGTGRFGRHHLRVLKELDKKNQIEFVGAVIRNNKEHKKIETQFSIKTYEKLTPVLLKSVDAVDIVTPPETHFEIVKKCLPYTNVFVEKPLAMKEADALYLDKLAKKYKHILTVGHIFRYHPVSEKLKEIIGKKEMPIKINGSFINPIDLDQGREPSFEFLHLFDVVDFLWARFPDMVSARSEGKTSVVDIRYTKYHDAHFILGCKGNEKIRKITFKYTDYVIEADFLSNIITYKKGDILKSYKCTAKQELLHKELYEFVSILHTTKKSKADASVAARIISIAEKAIPKEKVCPSVAIIGGGIFGTSIAAELGKFCSVTIFEKNSALLKDGTFSNCFRHHWGYHYPRSDETVIDIQNSRADFEEVYKKSLFYSNQTYYGLAKKDSYVSAKYFVDFCKKHKLPYEIKLPPQDVLARNEMSLIIKVPESNYNFTILKKLTEDRLKKLSNIKISYNTTVTNSSIDKDGKKTVTYIKGDNSRKQQKFDFIVNATYANINNFAKWHSFEDCPIRIDRTEVLILKLPMPPISLTIVDGPFACLMPTGNPHEFTLYHVTESILDRYVPKNGLVKKNYIKPSNKDAILSKSTKFFPILKDAIVTGSRITNRAVLAYREHDDSRVADIIEHGFGCWSILSGKILSSVTTGKKLAKIIKGTIKK